MKALIYFIPVMLFVSLNLTGCGDMSSLERVPDVYADLPGNH